MSGMTQKNPGHDVHGDLFISINNMQCQVTSALSG